MIEEIKAEINGQPPVERVWDEKIVQQQKAIRGAWLGAANELKETPDPNDTNLSGDIQSFVAAMPKIDTERHEIKAQNTCPLSLTQAVGVNAEQPINQRCASHMTMKNG